VGGNNAVEGYLYEMGIKDKDWVLINGDFFTDDGKDESTLGLEVGYFNKKEITWGYLLDSVIHTQEDLHLSTLLPAYGTDTSGFLVEINLICKSNHGNGGTALVDFTSGGPQTSASYLRCTEKIKEDKGSYYAYFLTFEFACNMYSDNWGERLWRKLENGRMELEIHVSK
jgi:hypothetical protein